MAGDLTIPAKFQDAGNFAKVGLAKVEVDGRCGFIDLQGNMVIEPVFPDAGGFMACDLAIFQDEKTGRYGCLDALGDVQIEPRFDDIDESFLEDVLLVSEANVRTYIRTDGSVVGPQVWHEDALKCAA